MRSRTKVTILAVLALLVVSVVAAVQPASACSGPCCWCSNPGVGTPGYWMNHPEAWPVEGLQIGNDWFTKDEAIAIMVAPVEGDKTYTMFPALVAAILNVRIGNCDCPFNVWMLLGQTQSWFRAYPLGSGVDADSDAWQLSHGELLYWRLDAYNNGLTCAPPRD